MTQIAVAVMPIADMGAWQAFADDISTGARSDAHRAFLRRGGVRSETLFHQPTPMGDLMVLVWDGVDSDQLAAHFGSMLANPTSDHERYLRDYVIPNVHGIDTAQPLPPPARQVAEITTYHTPTPPHEEPLTPGSAPCRHCLSCTTSTTSTTG